MEKNVIKLNLIQWVAELEDPVLLKKLLELNKESSQTGMVNEPDAIYKKREKHTIAHPVNLITTDPEILSGTPVFTGTRVPVRSLFDWLETETLEEFLDNFPSVSKTQALELLHYAEKLIAIEIARHEIIA